MESFVENHEEQLKALHIPQPLYEPLWQQLQRCFSDSNGGSPSSQSTMVQGFSTNLSKLVEESNDYGAMLVLPHLCSWEINEDPNRGLYNALSSLEVKTLQDIHRGLREYWGETTDNQESDKATLLDLVCEPRTWTMVILYRAASDSSVRAALPAPPYLPSLKVESAEDQTEADVSGPFPFSYHVSPDHVFDCSLGYMSPGVAYSNLPNIDLAPAYGFHNILTRHVRYVALLGSEAPEVCKVAVKEIFAKFSSEMHLVRQRLLLQEEISQHGGEYDDYDDDEDDLRMVSSHGDKVWKVYTDSNDPMGLHDPEAGLVASPTFEMTDKPEEADIIYSYKSLFAPGELRDLLEENPHILINQFPYEGALVQKDHLCREILKQHGLPLPHWALETYDLDVQLGEFVGSHLLTTERNDGVPPRWIAKPTTGTQSKGHVVTQSSAQILRMKDAGGVSRVAQKYIDNPICYEGRKVDCRCIVLMTHATPGKPTLYMHNRVYFRIASKTHSVEKPSDMMDFESVLTAQHLLGEGRDLMTLPVDHKTIAKLEERYKDEGFQWKRFILPKIQILIRELFNGMTHAYHAMGASTRSRGLYGIDVMFERASSRGVEPKLTEVTFCPSNNAICDAYEKDDELFRSYNMDIFNCMFLGKCNDQAITKLQ